MNLRPIPHADGDCAACGNPTLLHNTPDPHDGRLPMPGVPEGAIACCLEGCPALYKPIEVCEPPDCPDIEPVEIDVIYTHVYPHRTEAP